MKQNEWIEKHNFLKSVIFKFKVFLLILNRKLQNLLVPCQQFDFIKKNIQSPVIALSESDLWNPYDNEKNWILTAGKIENLRIAVKKINGLEVKANKTFSFWKHIGNPNVLKGYVVGREIREGCVVPNIAGGLCQLSNALYDAALQSNFKIVERHKHTKVIKGSLAEKDRDATVKWNYIDLKFKYSYDFRIECELTESKLIVCFKSKNKSKNNNQNNISIRKYTTLNDCYSCGNTTCFKNPNNIETKHKTANTTFILDEKWEEYDNYIKSVSKPKDKYIVPIKSNYFSKFNKYQWSCIEQKNTSHILFQVLFRTFKMKINKKHNVFELSLKLDKKNAIAASKKISIDSNHLVISQNLLPFIYQTGVLGGRTFDVLMTRLPFEKNHDRLDFAFSKYPKSKTLNDFRVSKTIVELENEALTKAKKIITPHKEIEGLFKNKVIKLDWEIPKPVINNNKDKTEVLFPASSLARKGVYEIRELVKKIGIPLTIYGGRICEFEDFWNDIKIKKFDGDFSKIKLIIYPTYIENQPRIILKAISMGIPVVTTIACGLEKNKNIKILRMNDFDQFEVEILKFCN